MNKSELVAAVAGKTKQTQIVVDDVVNAVLETIAAAVKADDKVTLKGFGTFELVQRAARASRNPRTGEAIHVPAKSSPKAKLTFGKTPVAAKAK